MAHTSHANKPVPLGLTASFGFGDRIGLATPGHARAMREQGQGMLPIFPQQSIREMTRTNRTATQVMADALNAMAAVGYTGQTGADADHLKTPADIELTAKAGFTFFTIDPSGEVDLNADNYDQATVDELFKKVAGEIDWLDQYKGKQIRLSTGTVVNFDDATLRRAAVKYGRAINLAVRLADHIRKTADDLRQGHEIELSVDETPQPTTLAEHYIIADQMLRHGAKLVSLAPRFVGEFEKGIDYIGDLSAFEKSLADHTAVMRLLGPYKLSLHSGSDKLSIYTALARVTGGLFHVKTAGTSYLEALRVVAIHDPALFRRIVDFARARYDTDKATYHVSATVDGVPPPSAIAGNDALEQAYLGSWKSAKPGTGLSDPGRQILHCTFGSTLTDPTFGSAVRSVLESHPKTYEDVLALHFGKHLQALAAGLK